MKASKKHDYVESVLNALETEAIVCLVMKKRSKMTSGIRDVIVSSSKS